MAERGNIFISISLVSNRPDAFLGMLDNLEETATNPERIEVVVRIDEHDKAMQKLVKREQPKRKLQLKYLSEPFEGFLKLWESFDRMHEITAAEAYFVQHYNDEVRYVTKGWDKMLEKYMHLFPDDIYRLRLSNYKLWNYFSVDEVGPHPENVPIHTKKWVDITGWCRCHSADSYQQMVAFFLAKGSPEWSGRYHRDIPVMDIELKGLDAGAGLSEEEQVAYEERARKAWAVLFSEDMQRNAQTKANLLRAHLRAHALGLSGEMAKIAQSGDIVTLIDTATGNMHGQFVPYKLTQGGTAYHFESLPSAHGGEGSLLLARITASPRAFVMRLLRPVTSRLKAQLAPERMRPRLIRLSNIFGIQTADLRYHMQEARRAFNGIPRDVKLTLTHLALMLRLPFSHMPNRLGARHRLIFGLNPDTRCFQQARRTGLYSICETHTQQMLDSLKVPYCMSVRIAYLEDLSKPERILDPFVINWGKQPDHYLIFDLSNEAIDLDETAAHFKAFHEGLKVSGLRGERIFLLTANPKLPQHYQGWASQHSPDYRIHPLGYHFYLFEYYQEIMQNSWFKRHWRDLRALAANTGEGEMKRPYYFSCFNLKDRPSRFALMLHLMQKGHLSKGIVTYFGEETEEGQPRTPRPEQMAFLQTLTSAERLTTQIPELLERMPITLGQNQQEMRKELWQREFGQVEFLIPELAEQGGKLRELFSYFEIVTETYMSDERLSYITEKTVRPIIRLQPFIHVGAPHMLKELREYGFKTFSPYINESYDDIEDPAKRMDAIFREIDRLCAMPPAEIHALYQKLWPAVKHNFDCFTDYGFMHKTYRRALDAQIVRPILSVMRSMGG